MSRTDGLVYATLDVFSKERFLGNQLAVVQMPKERQLDHETMQAVAKEFNFSETVFLEEPKAEEAVDDKALTWNIWIFTPEAELPFAGHPTIGTACFLGNLFPNIDKATLSTKAGPIPISYRRGGQGLPEATATVPQTLHIHKQPVSREHLLKLQPQLANQNKLAQSFPMVSVTDGMNFTLYQLDSIEALNSASPSSSFVESDFVALDRGWSPTQFGSYFYFIDKAASSEQDLRVHTRMIVKSLEDPATGSAACTLAGYLSVERHKQGLLKGNALEFDIEQGAKMGRKSHIGVRVELDANGAVDTIRLKGRTVYVTSGVFIC